MHSKFFIDFSTFGTLGLLSGMEFMIAFSVATFMAMITRYGNVRTLNALIRQQKDQGDRSALPAFREAPRKKRWE